MGDFHETRNDVDPTWSTVYAQTHSHLCFSSFRSLCPPLLQTSPALTRFKNLRYLRPSGCVKPCMLNDLRALTLRHNVILSTNSKSRQSGTMSPVNCSRMRTTKTPLPGQDYQRPVNVGKTPDFMSRLLLFILGYHRGIPWRDRSKKAPNTWSLCNEAAMQRAKSTHAWENKLKQFPWNLNPA